MLYSLRLVLKLAPNTTVTSSIRDVTSTGDDILWSGSLAPGQDTDNEWKTYTINLTVTSSNQNLTLRISSLSTEEWGLGSVSLTPIANTWRGMRLDVISRLKIIGFSGLLRYPGGCFSSFYRWKIGIFEPHEPTP